MWIENHLALCRSQIAILFHRYRFDLVGIVKQYAQITDTPNAGVETGGRFASFLTWVAKDAFF